MISVEAMIKCFYRYFLRSSRFHSSLLPNAARFFFFYIFLSIILVQRVTIAIQPEAHGVFCQTSCYLVVHASAD